MPGDPVVLGPFEGGLHNVPGSGEEIDDKELYSLINLEVDLDGTLANRPEIKEVTINGITAANSTGMTFIGVYLPNDGRKLLVVNLPAVNQVRLIDTATMTLIGSAVAGNALCGVQYGDNFYVPMTTASATGSGFFSAPTSTTVAFTLVATMPRGESCCIYRERMWIACGIGATQNTSRLTFSALAHPESAWTVATDFFDIVPGNGQKLVSVIHMGPDLVLLKERSTHRFTYSTDPRKAQIDEVDSTIGAPRANCAVLYNNSVIYVLSGEQVYELYQYVYSRVSVPLNTVKVSDLDLFAKDEYGLSVYKDRLFFRYFKHLYVYGLITKVWSEWVSTNKFTTIVTVPNSPVGLDFAYTTSASINDPNKAYVFQDTRAVSYQSMTLAKTVTIPTSVKYDGSAASVVVTVPGTAIAGDYLYLFHTHRNDGLGVPVTVALPGWDEIVPTMIVGDVAVVAQAAKVYRKAWQPGDANYTLTFSQSVVYREHMVVVRGSSTYEIGALTTLSNDTYAPIVIDPYPVYTGSVVLSFFAVSRTVASVFTTTLTGATKLQDAPTAGSSHTTISVSGFSTTTNGQFAGVTLNYTAADPGLYEAFSIILIPDKMPFPAGSEYFQGSIVTKTYDYDLPHQYKVMFWWGINVATSGRFTGRVNVTNATANYTWGELKAAFPNWGAAKAAGITWSNAGNIAIPDMVTPSVGIFGRRFVKMLKKMRFRQMYFEVVFDVVTNKGVADAALRIYTMCIFLKPKETVVRKTT